MKFIFKFAPRSRLAALILAAAWACRAAPATTPSAALRDGGDAHRLVALLDYVAGDYPRAVQNGVVVIPAEYDEQLHFAAEARNMATALAPTAPAPADGLLTLVAEVDARVRARADAAIVASACRAARDEAVALFRLRTMPTRRPSLAGAEQLYAVACATCHGASGDADTERARALDPAPPPFRDPARRADLSPFRAYNALTFGVRGTAMPSFDGLSPAERWDLAFYVLRLGHAGEPARGPVTVTLADMATRSDREMKEALRREDPTDPDGALAWVRREGAFLEAPTGVGIDRTRIMVRKAVASFAAGRAGEADRGVLDAYLEGFEPLEPRLRARDPTATADVEGAFRDLRAALKRGESAGVRSAAAGLDSRLSAVAGETRRPAVPLLAAFLIYFREGVEAALLVGALLAGARRLGRAEAVRFIHAGWLAALPAGVATWWVMARVIAISSDARELVEAVVALLAAAVLFSVSFWMISKAESRHWMAYLKRRLEGLSGRNVLLLSGLSFLAVYREAAETVLFTQALVLESQAHSLEVWIGAAAGIAAVAVLAAGMSRAVERLPLGPFFAVSGLLLCALAISFAGAGMYALVAAGYLPPRPVAFPEIPWMGIHPDLSALLVQLTIVAVIAGAGVMTLTRKPASETPRTR
jgi:high-affinity iron transporter